MIINFKEYLPFKLKSWKQINAIIVGATGATGQELVKQLLNDPNFKNVTVFIRKKNKIKTQQANCSCRIDFSKLNNIKNLIVGDMLFFSTLGTTKKEAGGKKEQYLVDFTYQYQFAKIASEKWSKKLFFSFVYWCGRKSHFFSIQKLKVNLKKL